MKESRGTLASRIGLTLLSGLLLGAAFLTPWPALGVVAAPVALVPWIVLFSRRGLSASPWLILPGAYLFAILALSPLVRSSCLIGLAAPFAFILFTIPFAVLLRGLPHRWWSPPWAAIPLLWVGTEWIRCTFSPGSLEIYLLGHGVAPITPLIQVADLVGAYGVSFLVAGFNGMVALEILHRMDRGRGGAGEAPRPVRLAVPGGLIVLACIYGLATPGSRETRPGPRLAAVRLGGEWTVPAKPREQEKRYVEQTYRTVPREPAVDLIVWPKDAIPDILLFDPEYIEDLKSLGNWFECPLIVGARGFAARFPGIFRYVAVHMTAAGDPARDYPQMVLLPGVEHGPLELQLRRLEREDWGVGWSELAEKGGKASRWAVRGWLGSTPKLDGGHDLRVFDIAEGLSVGAPLGLEGLRGRWCRKARDKGAAFVVSLDRGRRDTAILSRAVRLAAPFRAIENRFSFVRVEEDGDAFLIDPAGRVLHHRSGVRREDPAFQVEVPLPVSPTGGTPWGGEALGRLAALVTILLLGGVLMGTEAPGRPAPARR